MSNTKPLSLLEFTKSLYDKIVEKQSTNTFNLIPEQSAVARRGRPATAHLTPYERLNEYTFEHLKKCYDDLCFKNRLHIDPYISSEFDMRIKIKKLFTAIAFNATHDKIMSNNPTHKVFKIGRPAGSINNPTDALEALDYEEDTVDTGNVPQSEIVKTHFILSPDPYGITRQEITPLGSPATPQTNDLSKYALKTELQKVADALTTALKGYSEANFGKAFGLINKHSEAINELGRANNELIDQVNNIKTHKPTLVELKHNELPVVNLGVQHKHFPSLLKMSSAALRSGDHLNVWVHGPAGTGKSTAAKNVADALELPFFTDGKLQDAFEIKGYRDANGNYNTTQFRQAFELGGVYLADEIDGSMPDALLAFNSALANGFCAFPDKMVHRHAKFIFIAAANTTGTGATMEYVGRFKQDAAFNDRFVYLEWPIDDALETALCGNASWLARVRGVRGRLAASGIKGHLITPRATLYGEALLASGMTLLEVDEAVLRKGLSSDQWNKIK